MKKLIYLTLTILIVACSSDINQVHIDKIKQKVKKDAMGIDLNYKNVTFEWIDTLTVKKQISFLNTSYDEGINSILKSSFFSQDVLTKEKLITLRNWENGMRDTPFKYDGKKYKNYEGFALNNRDLSPFITDLCNQIEISDKLLENWSNLEEGNLKLIKNANWYYKRKANYNGTSIDFYNSINNLVELLEELKIKIVPISEMNPNDIIESKALNNYTINNPIMNGIEVDINKYFIFDKDYNIIRSESVE
jgi:hypothetical protein|tara:strand:- start:786 stop:1532 length:747 start_codon:yes stop_codon:yes gene_type:complete